MCFFFFKQKTAYEMRISDWSSDVCSSDLTGSTHRRNPLRRGALGAVGAGAARLVAGHSRDLSTAAADDGVSPDRLVGVLPQLAAVSPQIGRASCRERVCQYV